MSMWTVSPATDTFVVTLDVAQITIEEIGHRAPCYARKIWTSGG